MSCSPTLDKCDKFGNYFCWTYRNYNHPSLALGATDPKFLHTVGYSYGALYNS